MSLSALIMMCIACVGLWGGCGVFLYIMMKARNGKNEQQ